MPMDGITLGFLTDELNEKLRGGRIDKVQQPERDELLLTIRSLGANYRLLISANAGNARLHLTQQAKISPMEPPMFCMLLRKHLTGAHLLGFRQIGGDRGLCIEMENADELGVQGTRRLMVEIMGRHSNVMLVDAEGKIVDAIHHVNAEMSRVRQVQPGLPYQAPPSQGKLDPAEATAADLEAMLVSGGKLSKALMEGLSGFSNQAAQEIAFRLTGNADAYLEGTSRMILAKKLFELLRQMKTWRDPVSLADA
ncbi:MAG TPA: NFACT family protein, partial [Clostridia bacterium]|nr:NFACT family protein [Clostridia bacterium]